MTEEEIVGVFIGLQSSTYEYIAELIAPYQTNFKPVMGNFILIDNIESHIVARIMDYAPRGELVQPMGEKWLSDVALTPEAIGQDIKSKKICYRVKIKLLGVLNKNTKKFTPGIRELPHITSKVTCPDTEITKHICNQALEEQTKGPLIGEYWMNEKINIHFSLDDLNSQRTFIFARAGYGKSNLMKVLSSNWDSKFGGLVIFDPEGEYALTDVKKRPGIMDKKPCILITNRKTLQEHPNVYFGLKFNLKKFKPSFIIPILVSEAKHETVFFSKLMGLTDERWGELVDLLYAEKWTADNSEIRRIVEGVTDGGGNDQALQPIKNNLIHPINKLHSPSSDLLEIIKNSVEKGEVLIIDISLMDSHNALRFSSMIVGYFFNKNQNRFTSGEGDLIKAVFVMEEAQSVLGSSSNVAKFVELAKEGRKYSLGGIFITQQPGSIQNEILSQADNFFVFHLLSKSDLKTLQNANAHYSEDVLTQILSEPIKGKTYMWTSHQPFVLPVHIKNFEELAEAKKSESIQKQNNILGKILTDINKDDEIKIRMIRKLKNVLETFKNNENRQTIELYKLLDIKELEYCRQNDGIQTNSQGEEFAIKRTFFNKLKRLADVVVSNEEKQDEQRRIEEESDDSVIDF